MYKSLVKLAAGILRFNYNYLKIHTMLLHKENVGRSTPIAKTSL